MKLKIETELDEIIILAFVSKWIKQSLAKKVEYNKVSFESHHPKYPTAYTARIFNSTKTYMEIRNRKEKYIILENGKIKV